MVPLVEVGGWTVHRHQPCRAHVSGHARHLGQAVGRQPRDADGIGQARSHQPLVQQRQLLLWRERRKLSGEPARPAVPLKRFPGRRVLVREVGRRRLHPRADELSDAVGEPPRLRRGEPEDLPALRLERGQAAVEHRKQMLPVGGATDDQAVLTRPQPVGSVACAVIVDPLQRQDQRSVRERPTDEM